MTYPGLTQEEEARVIARFGPSGPKPGFLPEYRDCSPEASAARLAWEHPGDPLLDYLPCIKCGRATPLLGFRILAHLGWYWCLVRPDVARPGPRFILCPAHAWAAAQYEHPSPF